MDGEGTERRETLREEEGGKLQLGCQINNTNSTNK